MSMNIVLVEPEIPQNTGNIARTCAATGAMLHLVKPLGFSLDDRYMRRAGLDYWFLMRYAVYEDLEDFFRRNSGCRCWLASTKAARDYSSASYLDGDFLVFGRESRGLPEKLLAAMPEQCVRIPMHEEARSLNLSNAAAVVLYEALRQQGFPGLKTGGQLTGRDEPDAPWLDYLGKPADK